MKTMRTLITTVALTSLLVACAGAPVPLGSPINGTTAPTGTARPISADACGFQLFLLIPIAINSRLERAYGLLQAQAAGAVITDVEVQESWTYGFAGTAYCTTLRAKAIQTN